MAMAYRWKSNTRIKTDANIAGAVMEKLAEEGRLTPRNLVDESRDKDAPLHQEFEWDDSVAAENYREEQARGMIRFLEVVHEETKKEEPAVRAFVRAVPEAKHEYEPFGIVISDERKYSYLLEQATRELMAFSRKYAMLKELEPVMQAIQMVKDKAIAKA